MNTETQDIVKKRISDFMEKGCKGYLNLERLGLTEIPELPKNTQYLWIQGNKIKHIHTLPQSLDVLHISNNEIEYISTDLPENLSNLFISKNKLQCLPYLPDSLDILDISYNNIHTLPNIPRNMELLFCWGNPVPRELIERSDPIFCDIFECHEDRIKLWKKFLKQPC